MTDGATLRVKFAAELGDMKSAILGLQQQLKAVGAAGRAGGNEATAGLSQLKSNASDLRKTLAGIAAGFVSFAGAVQGIRAIVAATIESERATTQLNAKVKSLGGIAAATKDQVLALVDQLQRTTTFDDESLTRAATALLNFTNIDPKNFGRALEAAADLAASTGTDLEATIEKIGKALNTPEKAMKALRDTGVVLTEQQTELVKKLVETGNYAEAQAILLAELETRYDGAAEAARNTLGGALEGLKNDFENLLEGDTGSEGVRGTTKAIQDLSAIMQSPETKAGFQSMIQGLAYIAGKAIEAIGAITGLYNAFADSRRANIDKTYDGLLQRQRELQDTIAQGGRLPKSQDPLAHWLGITNSGMVEKAKRELAQVNALIAQRNQLLRGRVVTSPPATGGYPLHDTILIRGGSEPDDDGKAAAAAAKAKAEALREAAKASKEYQDALGAVDQVLRKTTEEMGGPALRAANEFKDTMLALAEAEAVLAKQGKLDEEQQNRLAIARQQALDAYQKQLKAIEEAERKSALAALEARGDAITQHLQSASTAIAAQADVGLLPQTEAEEQLQALRQRSIEQLQTLRAETVAYLKSLSAEDPAAQKALEFMTQLDVQIAEINRSQHQFAEQAKDQAIKSLSNFFSDLATGAKNFKDAFRDMVLSFVQGLARMAAEALAKQAVLALVKAIGGAVGGSSGTTITSSGAGGITGTTGAGLYHQGGIVGLASMRRSVSANPLLWGVAPRYHTGTLGAGLKSDEMRAILRKGEEVLTEDNPRHIRNGGGMGGRTIVKTPIVAIGDRAVADAMASAAGEDVVLTHVRNNWLSLQGGN